MTATPQRRGDAGFSLIEMSLVCAMATMVIGVAVLVFRAASTQQRRLSEYGQVELGSGAVQNFYGLNNTGMNTWFAPNYGRAIRADQLRDVFYNDVEAASAVYCLPRAIRSIVRPNSIPLSATLRAVDLDTPAAFLSALAAAEPDAASTFSTYRGAPPASARNGSIFIIQPNENGAQDELLVRCIWEVDFVPVSSSSGASGTYASVRRYVGFQLTHYYDVFYPNDFSQFGPVFVNFERAARRSTGPGAQTTVEAYKRAAIHPFYFIWWPDPAAPILRPNGGSTTPPRDAAGNLLPAGDFRQAYAAHYGQTSYFFVVPMFPCVR